MKLTSVILFVSDILATLISTFLKTKRENTILNLRFFFKYKLSSVKPKNYAYKFFRDFLGNFEIPESV